MHQQMRFCLGQRRSPWQWSGALTGISYDDFVVSDRDGKPFDLSDLLR